HELPFGGLRRFCGSTAHRFLFQKPFCFARGLCLFHCPGAGFGRVAPFRYFNHVLSYEDLVNSFKASPASWLDAAIVVAFDNRFEFVAEDHPDPMNRLISLQEQGGLPIGLAGLKSSEYADRALLVQVFQEYEGQGWAHRYMDTLRGIVRSH